MGPASASVAEGARKIEVAVLHALAERGQQAVAEAAAITISRVSRFKSNSADGGTLHLAEVAALFAAAGLVVVAADSDTVTIPREEYTALCTLTRKAVSA